MAVGMTKVSDLNGLFNVIYEDALFVARESNVMTQLVHHYSGRGWMARKITIRPTITATTKAEGEDFANPTVYGKSLKATLTPSMQFAQAIITDEDLDTDPDGAARDAAQDLGNAISTKIDKDLVGDFSSFTTDLGPGAESAATLATFAECIAYLRAQNTPNPVRIVLHPYAWLDIWEELGTPASNQAFLGDVANQALKDFYVGDWLNVRWFVSANITADDDDDVVNGVFNPGALAFDSRKAPTKEVERDASKLAWEYNMSAGYAHGVRRDEFGVGYTCDATAPS
jgi:hypothetical protein